MTKRHLTWGGARAGAGRPRANAIASEPHKERPALAARHPVHVVTRVLAAARPLGRRETTRAIQQALQVSLARTNFRIVRLSIRNARLELLVEADNKTALARGMQGFQVSAARRLNKALGRSGAVFPDRYRAAILRTRNAVRAAVAVATAQPRAPRFRDATATRFRDATATGALMARAWPLTWLLRVALTGGVRPRPRRGM